MPQRCVWRHTETFSEYDFVQNVASHSVKGDTQAHVHTHIHVYTYICIQVLLGLYLPPVPAWGAWAVDILVVELCWG